MYAPPEHTKPAPAPSGPIDCPNCGATVPPGFKFCGSCGHKLADADLAAAAAAAVPAPTPAPAPAPAPVSRPVGRMVLIRPDGSEGGAYDLQAGENIIGREIDPLFENDFYLSPRHVKLTVSGDTLALADMTSLNGVFYRIYDDRVIEDGTIFRIGQELLRFDQIDPPQPLEDGTEIMGSPNPGYWGRLTIIAGDGVDGTSYLLKGDAVRVGREGGDIQFPEDGYVSGSHLEISFRGGQYLLTDLNSSNGTFMKIEQNQQVTSGTFVLVGQQLFRVELTA
ncbi:MAG: FHA domain-containing protein [bacterium]